MPNPKKPRTLCPIRGQEPRATKGVYCSARCQLRFQHQEFVKRWKAGHEDGLSGVDLSNHVRRYLLVKAGYQCERCGWNEVNPHTGRTPLHMDHIDGDWSNCCESNLRVLCPNCHALTPTYGNRNSNGRHVEKQKRRAELMVSR